MLLILVGTLVVLPVGMLFQLVTAVAFLVLFAVVFVFPSEVACRFPTALVPVSVLLLRLFRIEWLLQAVRMFSASGCACVCTVFEAVSVVIHFGHS